MARRTVLTSRQRSVLFSLPQHEADLLRRYTLSEEDLHGWEQINLTGENTVGRVPIHVQGADA